MSTHFETTKALQTMHKSEYIFMPDKGLFSRYATLLKKYYFHRPRLFWYIWL